VEEARLNASPKRRLTMQGLTSRLRRLVNGIYSLLAQASTRGSRSTALSIVHWLFVFVLTGPLTAVKVDAPTSVLVMLEIFSAITFVVEIGAYCFLLATNVDAFDPKAFRSRSYELRRG